MGSFPLALGALGQGLVDILESIWSTSPRRAILWSAQDPFGDPVLDANGQPVQNALFPQVVVEERHLDEMRLTQHPVEVGAAITDHAYKLPSRVEIRGGWSFAAAGIPSPLPIATDASYLQAIYNTLLQIEAQRAFVTLVTGKRTYPNMMLTRLSVTTDEKTENVLSFVAGFEEVLLAFTQVVSVPDASVMKSPQINGAPTNLGQTSLLPGDKANAAALDALLPADL